MKLSVLYEKKGVKYDFSSVTFHLPNKIADTIIKWGRENIPNSLIVSGDGLGREDEIHITVKYGLTTDSLDEVRKLLENWGEITIKLGKITKFEADDYDVIKIDVNSKDLQDIHKLIKDKIPNEETYPKYCPHVTIAYVKKNECDDLIDNKEFYGIELVSRELTYSDKKHKNFKLSL